LLMDNRRWGSHGRGIPMKTLRDELNLRIDDFGQNPKLGTLIRLYYSLAVDYVSRNKFSHLALDQLTASLQDDAPGAVTGFCQGPSGLRSTAQPSTSSLASSQDYIRRRNAQARGAVLVEKFECV